MRCPYCSDLDNRVLDSRLTDEERSIRRRRECAKCGKRFTTYERFEETVLMDSCEPAKNDPSPETR